MLNKICFADGYKICHAHSTSHRDYILEKLLEFNFELQRYLHLWDGNSTDTREFMEDVADNLESLRTTILDEVAVEPVNNVVESSRKGKGKAKEVVPTPHSAFRVPHKNNCLDNVQCSTRSQPDDGLRKDYKLRPLNPVTISFTHTTFQHLGWGSQVISTNNHPLYAQGLRKHDAVDNVLEIPDRYSSSRNRVMPPPPLPKIVPPMSEFRTFDKVESPTPKLAPRYTLRIRGKAADATVAGSSRTTATREERPKRKRNVEEEEDGLKPLEGGRQKKQKVNKK